MPSGPLTAAPRTDSSGGVLYGGGVTGPAGAASGSAGVTVPAPFQASRTSP